MVQVKPVANNRGGSYLTMWSLSGIKFGILQVHKDHLMASYDINISCQPNHANLLCPPITPSYHALLSHPPIMPSYHALLLWVLADGSQGMLQQCLNHQTHLG